MGERKITVQPGGHLFHPMDEQEGFKTMPGSGRRHRAEMRGLKGRVSEALGGPEKKSQFFDFQVFVAIVAPALSVADSVREIRWWYCQAPGCFVGQRYSR